MAIKNFVIRKLGGVPLAEHNFVVESLKVVAETAYTNGQNKGREELSKEGRNMARELGRLKAMLHGAQIVGDNGQVIFRG